MCNILIYVTYINEVENYLKILFTHKYWEIFVIHLSIIDTGNYHRSSLIHQFIVLDNSN